MSTIITSIDPRSPAEKTGIRVGEQLAAINGHAVVDVLDYRFYGYDAVCRVELHTDGKRREVTVRKEEGQDLGLNFETYLMDTMHHCANHCVFCFIDQMPKGMRESLYVKDDDERLSFLLGNYTTLTNLSEWRHSALLTCTSPPSTCRCIPPTLSCAARCWAIRTRLNPWRICALLARPASG